MSVSKLHYLQDFIAVRRDERDAAAGSIGVETADPATVLASIDSTDDDSFQQALNVIDENVGFLVHDDPPAGVAALAGLTTPFESTVIHAVGLAGHWGYAPGTKAEPVSGVLPDVLDPDEGSYLAVIDSGLVKDAQPAWFADHVDSVTYLDLEVLGSEPASHGTFVASILRQLACSHSVVVARLPLVDHGMFVAPKEHPLGLALSTEAHLFQAMIRIAQANPVPPAALNLSLGTYTASDEASLIMTTALDFWFGYAPESLVFAAGGNEYGSPYEPFFPAAVEREPRVVAVGASDPYGAEVVWDYHPVASPEPTLEHAPTGVQRRPWIDRIAPGTDLVGLSGNQIDHMTLVKWSGSSFATPVALAMHLRGVSTDTTHAEVDGLSYAVSTEAKQVRWDNSPCALPAQEGAS